MEALASRPGGLARPLSRNGRMVCKKGKLSLFTPMFANAAGRCRRASVRCAYEEEYQVVDNKEEQVSSLDLKLQSSTRRIGTEGAAGGASTSDATTVEASRAQARASAATAEKRSSKAGVEDRYLGRVMDVVDRVSRIIGMSRGQLALLVGAASLGLAVSGPVLSSVEMLPFAPEAMQTVGVAYSVLVASRIYQGRTLTSMPSSPFRVLIEAVDGESRKVKGTSLVLPGDLEEAVKAALEKLVRERDEAVSKLQITRTAAEEYSRVVQEKEALEAVAMQLAEERDSALADVAGLKAAVDAMTERMLAFEQFLDQEVNQLRQNNSALETISLQLAGERDAALEQVRQLKEVEAWSVIQLQEKEAVELVAAQLAQERDAALAEIQELRLLVPNLREDSTSSGLTPEQEVFIQTQARASHALFLDEAKSSSEQEAEVERFVQHLVQEYGAPREWVANYVRNLSDSKPVLGVNGALSTGEVRSVHAL